MTEIFDARRHWDGIYSTTQIEQTGWYEAEPTVSLELVEHCGLDLDARIADIGSGNSTLIPALLDRGYRNLVAVDISGVALDALRQRLGDMAQYVDFVRDDMTDPQELDAIEPVSLWHDRAMLHFLTGTEERDRYRAAIRALVDPAGHAILGEFADDGAEECSGLPVVRFNEAALDRALGHPFRREEVVRYTYVQPSGGLRPYVYARYRHRR